ncbi:hypothetical protein IGI04_015504 [Brassica rapa subsp. trilocularis]|uniref:Uncharacterized protein n=2 Tax=Brassica campestris TaxID=3711 RepID=M4EA38_BRACM|nr:hypothetical protein IGI04_015504 [Brassica rapa subsp. trilocularis]
MANNIAPSGQLTTNTDAENLPGFPKGILGIDIVDKFHKQSERFGTEIFTERSRRSISPRGHSSSSPIRELCSPTHRCRHHLHRSCCETAELCRIWAYAVCDGATPIFTNKIVLMTVPDSGAIRVTVPDSGATRVTVLDRAEQPECMFQRQRFLRKLQPISGFALISLFSLPAACGFDISSFYVSPDYFALFLEKKPDLRVGDLRFCYFVKGEGHLSRLREEPP